MSRILTGKAIVLGVTGSIAAYKAVDLASKLTQAGAQIDVLMTSSAQQFVAPLTFRSITHRPVLTDLFDINSSEAVEHVALANRADLIIVAPATANSIAKLAYGMSDDAVSIVALATESPLIIAPAMDGHMWQHPAVQQNVTTLASRGASIVGPSSGRLASGLQGQGRMAEPEELVGAASLLLGKSGDMRSETIVVTAGGTREAIDPVRVISNRSSGKMGFAIAEAARDRGAKVILITGPTALNTPFGVQAVSVESASEMNGAVMEACKAATVIIMAAAVADYRPASESTDKLKKDVAAAVSIDLERTTDILSAVPRAIFRVGFAAESSDLVENATAKLKSKALSLVVANDISQPGIGFDSDDNRVSLIDHAGMTELPVLPKIDVAHHILDRVAELLSNDRAE